MLWHEKSWQALSETDRAIPVVLPLGSLEQHGHHLPLCVDTVQVDAVARQVEAAMPQEVLLLPTQWLGCSHHHRDFPGTISLLPSLYSEMIKSIVGGILDAGFYRIFLLNGHGGNQVPLAQALTELVATDDRADAALLSAASWWQVGKDALAPQHHGMLTPFISHACEYETSLMLTLRPDLVSMAAARPARPVLDSPWYAYEYGGKVNVFKRFHRLTASGSMGAPQAATAAKGASILRGVVEQTVRFLQEFRDWPLPEVARPRRRR